jgi:hypothetical protein
MNLRSQNAATNNVTWNQDTQYFLNDVVRSPVTGGLYVYEAFDQAGDTDTAWTILSANDPSSPAGVAEGWAPFQSVGLKTVVQTPAAVTGTAAGAAGALGATASLLLPLGLPNGLGVASTWLVNLSYTASLTGGGAFAATEWATWTVTSTGAGPVSAAATHVFGAGAVASGSPVSIVLTAPPTATTLVVSGIQSATSAVLLFTGSVTATFSRLS